METRKFKLGCLVTVSAYTAVEALTLAEAIKIVEEREMVIGGIGTGTDQNEQWIVDEVDGEPMGITSSE